MVLILTCTLTVTLSSTLNLSLTLTLFLPRIAVACIRSIIALQCMGLARERGRRKARYSTIESELFHTRQLRHLVSWGQPNHPTTLPCRHAIMPPCHYATMPPCHHATILPYHHATMPPCHNFTTTHHPAIIPAEDTSRSQGGAVGGSAYHSRSPPCT